MFFETIDRDGDGEINFDELKNYYKDFVGVKPEKLDEISKEGFRVLTAVSFRFRQCDQIKIS